MRQKILMVQGTTSDAGKSTLVTALCRIFYRQGIAAAPFKPQNMALNSAVTADGGEIGRAQAVQAQAAGLEPHTDMNPVLLKPDSDTGAQVIIHGKALSRMEAEQYHDYKKIAMDAVLSSHHRLEQQYQRIIVEGAGSPAEINLRDGDIANMGFAEAVDCPVILIADIDKGGVFAHLVGTLALLSESEQRRVKGFVINRFRGNIKLLEPGLKWLEQRTGKPVLGVIPYLHGFHLEAEDAIATEQRQSDKANKFRIIIPVLPRISNHTDFDPLRLHPEIDCQFIPINTKIPPADLIILPGSKSVRSDLAWIQSNGWETTIQRHLRYGGKLLGICGGYQMLGTRIHDPEGIESKPGSSDGLALLNLETRLDAEKQLTQCSGYLTLNPQPAISGYEIHTGVTTGADLKNPVIHYNNHTDGAISEDHQIMGSYLHGLFNQRASCDSILRWAGMESPQSPDYTALQEAEIDRLANTVATHVDMKQIDALFEYS